MIHYESYVLTAKRHTPPNTHTHTPMLSPLPQPVLKANYNATCCHPIRTETDVMKYIATDQLLSKLSFFER